MNPEPDKFFKARPQRMGAAFKKRHVHIPVRTVVGLVHKAGLRRKMHPLK